MWRIALYAPLFVAGSNASPQANQQSKFHAIALRRR